MKAINAGLALVLSLGLAAPVWADRLLLESSAGSVILLGAHACAEPVNLAVAASDPAVFEGDSPALQSLVDAARAMLAYECPDLREIEVQGRLSGLSTNVYRGVASRDSQWRLDSLESIRAEAAEQATYEADPEPAPAPGFRVVGLGLGMSQAVAAAAIREGFRGEPGYDEAKHRLTFYDGGCPEGYDASLGGPEARAGWVCLKADFADAGMGGLQALDLVQVIGGTDTASIADALGEKFGPPTDRWTETEREGGLFGDSREVEHLTWGEALAPAADAAHPTRELHAQVHAAKDGVVVRVLLRAPGVQSVTSGTELKL